MTTWTPRPDMALSAAASGPTRVLPSPVFISAILPWCSDDAAHQLDVEGAHAQLAAADLARGREDLRQRLVEDALEVLGVGLLARPTQLAAALRLGVLELFLGRRGRRGLLADLVADDDHPLADLVVGEGRELVGEVVDVVDERLELLTVGLVGSRRSGR